MLGLAATGRQPEPAVRVRLDLQDHLRRWRGQLLRRLAGQHRLVSAARRQEVDRAGQGQPVAAPEVLRDADGVRLQMLRHQQCWRRSSRWSSRSWTSGCGLQDRVVDRTQGRLLHQPRRAARHGQAHRGPGQGRRYRGHRGRGVVPVPERSRRQEHPHRAEFSAAGRPGRGHRRLATCALLAATE